MEFNNSLSETWTEFCKSDEFKNVFTYGEFIPEYEEMDDILAFYRSAAASIILFVANY